MPLIASLLAAADAGAGSQSSQGNIGWYILIGLGCLFGGLILWGICYKIAQVMKGSIRLAFPRRQYQPGDQVDGSCFIKVGKPVTVNRCYVALVADQRTRHRDSDGDTSTRWVEIFREEVDLDTPGDLRPGTSMEIPFSLVLPQLPERGTVDLPGMLGSLVNALADNVHKVRWRMEARVDCPGVDLTTREDFPYQPRG